MKHRSTQEAIDDFCTKTKSYRLLSTSSRYSPWCVASSCLVLDCGGTSPFLRWPGQSRRTCSSRPGASSKSCDAKTDDAGCSKSALSRGCTDTPGGYAF